MRVVSYNIQWGKGRDGQVDLGRVARTVAQADVIGLQEVERHWREMPDADEVARLAALLPGYHPAFCTAVDFHNPADPALRRQYGLMVLSRWPSLSVRSFPLPRATVIGQVSDPSILMECVIGHPVLPFRLYLTHLNWVSARARARQAEAIVRIIAGALAEGPPITGPGAPDSEFGADWMMIARDELPPMPAPAIVMGDFNTTPSALPLYKLLETANLKRAACGGPVAGTWRPIDWSGTTMDQIPGLKVTIDHILVRDLDVQACHVGPDIGSDHFPLIVTITQPN